MLNKCSHNETAGQPHLWGVNICPLCKGMGVLSSDERKSSASRIADYICPLCDLHRDTTRCPGWEIYIDGDNAIWYFDPEYACDEMRIILKSLTSIEMKRSCFPVR